MQEEEIKELAFKKLELKILTGELFNDNTTPKQCSDIIYYYFLKLENNLLGTPGVSNNSQDIKTFLNNDEEPNLLVSLALYPKLCSFLN